LEIQDEVRSVEAKMKILAGFGRLCESVTSIMKGFAMKFGNVLLSSVLAFCLSTVASAEFADNFSGTQTGTWGTASWTGSQAPPSGGSLSLSDGNKSHEEAKLQLYLGAGQAASDIGAGGGFVVEFDVDSVGNSGGAAFNWGIYHDGAGVLQLRWADTIRHWEWGPVCYSPGLYKFEFVVTSGTWGTGTATTSITAYKHDGSDWFLNPTGSGGHNMPHNATMTITDTQWAGLMSFGATAYTSGGSSVVFGNDLPGGIGLKIYAPPPPYHPAIGANNVARDVVLSWAPGDGATEYDIYFGTDSLAVKSATTSSPEYMGRQPGTTFDPPGPIAGTAEDLLSGVTYYWRIDDVAGSNINRRLVWNFTTTTSARAQEPSPASGTEDIGRDVVLGWEAGVGAVSHDVYFGIDKDKVTNADTSWGQYRGNQTDASYDPPGTLELGRTYYWRIDEVDPYTAHKGDVWEFTMETGRADSPVPGDGQLVPEDPMLVWQAGTGAILHNVYLGTDYDLVANATVSSAQYKGYSTEPSFDPGTLDGAKYYWRIDEVGETNVLPSLLGPDGAIKGQVWSFITAAAAFAQDPSPADGNAYVAQSIILAWTAGTGAVSHDVYFGTDPDNVANADTGWAEYRGNQTETSYDPPETLVTGETYYWRIDEVDAYTTHKGHVWSFSVMVSGQNVGLTDNFAGTQTGTWAPESWSTGSNYVTPSGGSLSLYNNSAGPKWGQLAMYLTLYRPASDIEHGGGFTVEFDVDVHSPGIKTGSQFFVGGWAENWMSYWSNTMVHGAGLFKFEFEITDGTWGTGTVFTTVRAYEDLGSGWVEFTPRIPTATFNTDNPVYINWYAYSHDSEGGPINWILGNDLPGGVGLKIAPFADPNPQLARTPVPKDGALDIAPDVVLGWYGSYLAGAHDVYFGDDETAVTDATTASDEYKGRQSATTFDPEGIIPGPDDLVLGRTYYWRIDEFDGVEVHKGHVWSFTVTRRQAENPTPGDGASNIPRDVVLGWTPGPLALSHDVYFGTNKAIVTIAEKTWSEYRGNQTHTSYDPPEQLQLGRTYYWRIDEVDQYTTRRGDVWEFTMATGQANNPVPGDGRACPVDVLLGWQVGAGSVTSHNVYFGTDPDAVANATTASAQFKGNFTQPVFDPGSLAGATRYYWRVDEIGETYVVPSLVGPDGAVKGPLWTFVTPGYDLLQVDLALPYKFQPGDPSLVQYWIPTAKEGWTIWLDQRWWDLYMHDWVLYPDIGKTGINAALSTVYDGEGGVKVNGMYMENKAGGGAEGFPQGEPIANSWYYAVDHVNAPRSSIVLCLQNLPAGEYWVRSYHNYWEPCSGRVREKTECANDYGQGMQFVRAMSMQQANDYYAGAAHNVIPTFMNYAGADTGGITSIADAVNVMPTHTTTDADVATSLIKFTTDGSPVIVAYEAAPYQDTGDQYKGPRGILNAFEIQARGPMFTAGRPSPADGDVEVERSAGITWTPGGLAVSHEVYFGTDQAAVADGTATKVTVPRGTETLERLLVLGQAYYWRVDEVGADGTVWPGEVWSFATAQCTKIEDFEGELAWEVTGGGWLESSSDLQRSGLASLQLQYYNRSPNKSSGASMMFDEAQNFNGYEALGFYHMGEAGNQDDKLYVVIEDADGNSSTVVSSANVNLSDTQWQLWSAELTEFAGVDLANVTRIEIGVGTPGGSSSSAIGNLYIDDVGLCGGGGAGGCPCFGDLNVDGQIDLADLQAVAGILLDAGSPFIVPVEEDHCGNMNDDLQIDLEDLQLVAGVLLDVGSPFIVRCP